MLFTESQLSMGRNPMAVLDEATYLDENEAIIRPQTVPVRENTRIGAYVVDFDDIHRLAENHGIDYIDAVVSVAEASGIDPTALKVAVNEAEIICNPEVVLALPEAGVVVAPISESSLAYQYVTECIDLWSQMPDTDEADMALAEALIDDTYLAQFIHEAEEKKDGPGIMDRIKGAASGAMDSAKSGLGKIADFTGASKFGRDFDHNKKKNLLDQELEGKDNTTRTAKIKANASGLAGAAANNKLFTAGAVGVGVAAVGGAIALGKKILGQADNKPKSWIGQKIASLRSIYQKWMEKAQKGGPGIGDKIKQAAAKLLSIIDALMKKMQNAAG